MSNNNSNLILIVCDELVGLKYLDKELLKTLNGIQKFKKKCLYFNNHYANTMPCSASRSVMYTGKNTNETKVTDNVQSTIPWQKSMITVSEGLKTLGTYFKNLNPRYIGKMHLLQELDPNNYTRFKPRLATEKFLSDYDFENYTKTGDFTYDGRLAYFNDSLVTKQILPSGTNKNKCDYYDEKNNICLDGAIPYMQTKILNGENFALCCNYDNPHDILYSNVSTKIDNLKSITGQISGVNLSRLKNIQTVGNYNDNYTKYSEINVFNSKSLELDNCVNSLTNIEQLNVGILIEILSKYYYYGIEYHNINEFNEYQTAYYRCVKQVDEELEKLYDFMESNGLFENSIICLTSDHGDYVCAHGLIQKAAPIYNQGSNIPLFLSYPNMPIQYKNYTSEIITSHINLLPTLMTLNGYDINYIKSENLANSFIDSNGIIIEQDYNVTFTFLSVTFGSALEFTLKNLQDPNINSDLEKFGLDKYNSLTIQDFSVCSKFIIDNRYINCGYYFSELHVYIDTIKYYYDINKNKLLKNINFANTDNVYILQDKNNSVSFGYIGNKNILYFQLFTDPVVKLFNNPIIKLYDYNDSPYSKYLFENPNYDSYIVGFNTYDPDISFFSNKINSDELKLKYIITNGLTKKSDIVYIGSIEELEIILKTDSLVSKLIENPTICSIYSFRKKYIFHPIFSNVLVCFNSTNKNNVLSKYNNFSNINNILINIVLNYNYSTLFNIVSQTINSCVNNLIFESLKLYNSDAKLRLPGVDFNIQELKKNGFQVQLFDNTNDFDEIFNLVDISRINKVDKTFINNCYSKLYENIKINKLENIFISLPNELIFSTTDIF